MVDVFDSCADMGGTKFPTDIAHRDVSPSRRNQLEDVKKTEDSLVVHLEDRPKTSELRRSSSSKKLGGTTMKMLIAQEMSKETAFKKKPSNVVARLMGLDEALPTQEMPTGRADRGHPARVTLAGVLNDCRQQDDSNLGMPMPCGIRSCAHVETKNGDVYEVWQQPPRTRRIKDQYLHKGRYDEIQSERRMALVRHKFMEAKQMATKERLLKSKEFGDTLEVLSSNRDLFLKFLEKPNPLFSNRLKELHSKPTITQTQRITVLKPLWTPMTKGDIQKHLTCAESGLDFDKPQWRSSATQPTRIVVLKPTTTRHHENDTKPIVTSQTSSIEKSGSYTDLESHEFRGSLAKDLSHQTRGNIGSHRREESLLSSVFSYGHVGGGSSFSRSENEYTEEGANFCDSEIVTPTLPHSWDYVKRYGSPYSSSSFSQVSCSPEPYVTREAKKRLSERCALVTSKGFNREQMEVRRSSTLGEMLAASEITEEVEGGQPNVSSSRSCGGEEDTRVSIDCLPTSKTNYGDGEEGSTWNLSRSKSVPASSSAYKNIRSISEVSESRVQNNSEVPDSQVKKPIVPKEVAKSKSGKSSFKGKVSRLFFSRNKKTVKEKSISSPLVASDDRIQYDSTEPSCDRSYNLLNSSHNSLTGAGQLIRSEEESVETSTTKDGSEQGNRAALFLEKPSTPEFLGNREDSPKISDKTSQKNQDQPSPISVLDVPFEDDSTSSNSCETSGAGRPLARIEEVARSLAWDDTHLEQLPSPSSSKLSRTSPKATEEEGQWHLFVRNLLSTAGLGNEKLNAVFTRFYSVDNPLDPNLLNMFLDQKEEGAKSRERRSNLRLLFDCVNSALIDIDHIACVGVYPWARNCNGTRKKVLDGILVGAEVVTLVSDWLISGEEKLAPDSTDNDDLVVERQVSRDISGSGWAELVRSEIDGIGKEISGELLEDLLGEALTDFSVA